MNGVLVAIVRVGALFRTMVATRSFENHLTKGSIGIGIHSTEEIQISKVRVVGGPTKSKSNCSAYNILIQARTD